MFIRNGLSSNLKDMVGAEYRSYHQAKGRHHAGINNGNKEVWLIPNLMMEKSPFLYVHYNRSLHIYRFFKQVKT